MSKLLHAGLHPAASAALVSLGIDPSRIVQTIGNATASAGTHARDGEVDGVPYCAATDFSIHHPTQLDADAIKHYLDRLATVGYAGYYRWPGHDHWPATDEAHIHAVYAGCPMKLALRTQIHDWCHGRNGLQSHAPYTFWQPSPKAIETVRELFLAHNQPVG